MFNSKKFKELEKRVCILEKELDSIKSASSKEATHKKDNKSYEEVMTEWLCGKEQP